jgi:hypothetical protein
VWDQSSFKVMQFSKITTIKWGKHDRTVVKIFAVLGLALFSFACSTNDTLVQEYMTVSPHQLTFTTPDTTRTMTVAHSCTCPFTWTLLAYPPAPWLTIPAGGSGDQNNVLIKIDRSLMTTDTAKALIQVNSTQYSTSDGRRYDTVQVTAYRK